MKSFLTGAFGALLMLALVAVVRSQYSDYRAYGETYGWIVQLRATQEEVANNATRLRSLAGAAAGVKEPSFWMANVTYFNIDNAGVILVKGGRDGQTVMLIPSMIAGEVAWICVGGPDRDMPEKCKDPKK